MREIKRYIPGEIFLYQIHLYHTMYKINPHFGEGVFHLTCFDDFDCDEGDIITVDRNDDFDAYSYNLEKFPRPIKMKVKDISWWDCWDCGGDLIDQHDVVKKYYTYYFLRRFAIYFLQGELMSEVDPLILEDKSRHNPWDIEV